MSCIDCGKDSIMSIWNNIQTKKDSIYAIETTLDNYNTVSENFPDFTDLVNKLVKLCREDEIIDTLPYTLFRDAFILWDSGSERNAVLKMQQGISEFDKNRKIFGGESLFNYMRPNFSNAGMHTERLQYYQSKLEQYKKFGPKENMAVCYHAIGGYYYNYLADYEQAINYYLKSSEVFKTFSPYNYCNELGVIGWSYYYWGNYNRAKYYLELSNPLAFELKRWNIYIGNKIILGLINKETHDYATALKFMDEAGQLLDSIFIPSTYSIYVSEKAGVLIEMQRIEEAFPFLLDALNTKNKFRLRMISTNGLLQVEYYFFKYYMYKGNFDLAEKWLITSYSVALSENAIRPIQLYRKELASFYTQIGNVEKANIFSQLYIHANDSIKSVQDALNIAQYENDRLQQEQEENLRISELQKLRQRNYFLMGSILLFIIAVGTISRLQYIRRTKKHLEEKNRIIEIAKEKAEEREKFEQQFLANMSHEIRTPINAVTGMAEILLHNTHLPEQEKYLNAIQQSGITLLHLINDILDISKVESGKLELEQIDFSISEVLSQVKQILSIKVEEKGLDLILHMDPEMRDVVVGDPHRLNQILLNLCNNAVKYTEKGHVQIEVYVLKKNDNEQTLRFTISDTGIGIPKEKLKTIFETFKQAHASDSRKYGGTGLGLSISKQLIEMQGGNIEVASEVGFGSSFIFNITYAYGNADAITDSTIAFKIADASALDGLRILLVDDNAYNRIVAEDAIHLKAHVFIATAANGKEAIDQLTKEDFDVILMDIQMPVMDGYEATHIIRTTMPADKKDIPIIALTASVMRSDLHRCLEAGMNTYVPKPFKIWELLKAIAEVTGRSIQLDKQLIHAPQKQEADTIVDIAFLQEITDGNNALIETYISTFISNTKKHIAAIEEALTAEDYDTIGSLVHLIKPHYKMMGVKNISQTIIDLEMYAKEKSHTERIPGLFKELKSVSQLAFEELENHLE